MNKMSPEQIIQHIKFVKEDIKETTEALEKQMASLHSKYGKLILLKP